MSDTQLLILVTGAVLAIAIIGLIVYFIAKGNWQAAIQIAAATRADLPVLDKIEAAATQVVPVELALKALALAGGVVPTMNADQERFKQIVIDILHQITDGKPNLPPVPPPGNG